jgi:hypothetical protein
LAVLSEQPQGRDNLLPKQLEQVPWPACSSVGERPTRQQVCWMEDEQRKRDHQQGEIDRPRDAVSRIEDEDEFVGATAADIPPPPEAARIHAIKSHQEAPAA